MRFLRILPCLLSLFILQAPQAADAAERAFFQAAPHHPYHLSIGAVLFDQEGRIACHHFEEVLGFKDIYILMRESVENGEEILTTLHRGLKEEFGATATPIAFLGPLSGFLLNPTFSFEKTTLYIACQVDSWDPAQRDMNDPESISIIEWLEPEQLIKLMEQQGKKFKRVDADESTMIRRALPYIKQIIKKEQS